MIVLIPAFEPDARLPRIVGDLRAAGLPVIVVDDGSGPSHGPCFEQCAARGAEVLRHPVNRGKGAALKTGFAHVASQHPGQAVVCADSDGQHAVPDILRVADAVLATGADQVLGVRRFTGRVPARSRLGNAATRVLFGAVTGVPIADTQTGLRAYPASALPWLLSVEGERFEYELRLLLAAARAGQRIEQIEIATIYLDENASSHFRPLADSARIYGQVARFLASSFLGFVVDAAALALLFWLTSSVLLSVVGARLVSGSVNFTVNRRLVFRSAGEPALLRSSLPRYAALAAVLLLGNLLLMEGLVALGFGLLAAKVVTEVTLFTLSFVVQRSAVFVTDRRADRKGRQSPPVASAHASAAPE